MYDKQLPFLVLAGITLLLAGCPEDSPRGTALSCIYGGSDTGSDAGIVGIPQAGAFCAEYDGDVTPTSCADLPGYVSIESCPEADRIAVCVMVVGTTDGLSASKLYFYSSLTIEVARLTCESVDGALTEL